MTSLHHITIFITSLPDDGSFRQFVASVEGFCAAGVTTATLRLRTGDRSADHARIPPPGDTPDAYPHVSMEAACEWVPHRQTDVAVVIDPAHIRNQEILPALLDRIDEGADIAVAAMTGKGRDEPEGITAKGRRLLHGIVWRTTFPDTSDPWSTCFAARSGVVRDIHWPRCSSTALAEVLGRGKWSRLDEIALPGRNEDYNGRQHTPEGECISRMSVLLSLLSYALSHRDTAVWREWIHILKFASVGVSGIFVEMALLFALTEWGGLYYLVSGAIAIEASIINNFIWNERWTFGAVRNHRISRKFHRFLSYQAVTMASLIINLTVLYTLTTFLGVYYLVSNLFGIFTAFAWNYVVNRNVTWREQ